MITLTTERLILRPFKETDIDELFEIIQDKDIKRFLPGVYATSKEELKKTLDIYVSADFKNDIYLAITERGTGKLIGALILVRICGTNMEISYFMYKEKRENGLMFEAIRAFVKWYAKSGLNGTIYLGVSKHNESSLYLCTKMAENDIPILRIAEDDNVMYFVIRSWCLDS